jgi:hypothetical protein
MIILLLVLLALWPLPVNQTADQVAPLKLTVTIQARTSDNGCAPIYHQYADQKIIQSEYDLVSNDDSSDYHPYCTHFTLTNISDHELKFYVMSCSYTDNWRSDNAAIAPHPRPCRGNAPYPVTLAAGQSYQGTFVLVIANRLASRQQFKLAFQPTFDKYIAKYESEDHHQVWRGEIWSEPITINR